MKKRVLSLFIIFVVLFSFAASFAQDDDGVIDFYSVFSKDDVNKNKVGNSVYNWSIYMPQDAYINKDPKGTYFSMSSNSYKANISIDSILNTFNYSSLDEIILYGKDLLSGYYGSNKLYSLIKGKDKLNQQYIETTNVYTDSFYVYVDEEESTGQFTLTRIYLSTNKKYNYIYRVMINMDLKFYREHPNLLYKIADSFEMNFDSKNPNIKDLADNVTNWRVQKNTSYGWQIDLPPYWRTTDMYNFEYNSSTQSFAPLYSDEEMGKTDTSINNEAKDSVAIQPQQIMNVLDEYLTVSVISTNKGNFDSWLESEKESYKKYNSLLYKVEKISDFNIANSTSKLIEATIQQSANKKFVEKRLLVESNNTKYLVRLYVLKSKYDKNKAQYERILSSFKPINQKSKYLGTIIWPGDLSIKNTTQKIKFKKYPFEMQLSKDWRTNQYYYGGMGYYYEFKQFVDYSVSDFENLTLYNVNNTTLNISCFLSMDSFENRIKNYLQPLTEDNNYKNKLIDITVEKFSTRGLNMYKVSTRYNIKKVQEVASENMQRDFDFNALFNRTQYFIGTGKYFYTIDLNAPVMYWTNSLESEFDKAFKSINIENIVDLSKVNIKWVKDNISNYQKKDK
ncbi:hypothetical protein ACAG39_06195 [Caldicellulosiruptoraceae bacterium PP1]